MHGDLAELVWMASPNKNGPSQHHNGWLVPRFRIVAPAPLPR